MVIIAEQLGQQQLSLVMPLERRNRILLAQLERQYVVRLENAAELLGNEVAAVVSSQISCAPQDGQLYTRILSASVPQSSSAEDCHSPVSLPVSD